MLDAAGHVLIPEKEDVMETAASVTAVRPYFIVDGADDLIAFLQQTFDAELLGRVPAPGNTVMLAPALVQRTESRRVPSPASIVA